MASVQQDKSVQSDKKEVLFGETVRILNTLNYQSLSEVFALVASKKQLQKDHWASKKAPNNQVEKKSGHFQQGDTCNFGEECRYLRNGKGCNYQKQ